MKIGRYLETTVILAAAAVLGFLAYASAVGLYKIDNYAYLTGSTAALGNYTTIKVYARQYAWIFVYPNGTQSINKVYLYTGKLYRFEITSMDVVHSFYIVQLGIKYDAVPGFWYTLWVQINQPGTYYVWCAQYCGTGHYLMEGEIVVLPSN